MLRLGGWIMTIDEAGKWAGPHSGQTWSWVYICGGVWDASLQPRTIWDWCCLHYIPQAQPKNHDIVTRRAPWSGWRLGDDPKVLPQFKFKPGNREHVARLALEKHGKLLKKFTHFFLVTYLLFPLRNSAGVLDIQFVTAHGKLWFQ